MFWRGSKGSPTPKRRAVKGMSCIRPCAPFDETAQLVELGLDRDHGRTRSALTPWTRGGVHDVVVELAVVGAAEAARVDERALAG